MMRDPWVQTPHNQLQQYNTPSNISFPAGQMYKTKDLFSKMYPITLCSTTYLYIEINEIAKDGIVSSYIKATLSDTHSLFSSV